MNEDNLNLEIRKFLKQVGISSQREIENHIRKKFTEGSVKIGKTIKHMADQEQEHIDTFDKLIVERKVRPTAFMPIWNLAGYSLGIATALMGEKAAMACTVAVEDVIGKHYEKQAKQLGNKEQKLKKTILKFRDDELEHHDIGLKNEAEKTIGYNLLSKAIKTGCKIAIEVSKKV